MSITESRAKMLRTEILVGLFFLAAIAILGFITVVLTPQALFQKTFPLQIQFTDIGALKEGDQVKMKGVVVGKVRKIEIAKDFQHVLVTLSFLDHKPVIHSDYMAQVNSASVLGGQFVNINPGTPAAKLVEDGAVLDGTPPIDLIADATKLINAFREDEKFLRKALAEDKVLDKVNIAVSNFQQVSEDTKVLTAQIRSGEGTLGQLIMKDDFIKNAQEQLNAVSDAGKKVGDAADRFKSFGDELSDLIADAKAGKGTLGKLLKDEGLYTEIERISQNLTEFSERLNAKEGTLYRITADQGKLYGELETTLKNLREVSEKINNGDGTLAQLINDPKLYKETLLLITDARKAIGNVNSAIQDLREQAPISTFGNIVFGAL